MVNIKNFNNLHIKLINIIKNSNILEKEKNYRLKNLNRNLEFMIKQHKIKTEYYSLAHELKSYEFFKNYGQIKLAYDSSNEAGPDIKLNNYYIECVCSTSGTVIDKLEKYQLNDYRNEIIYDYDKLLELVLPRLTGSLNEKSYKFKKYINNRNYFI